MLLLLIVLFLAKADNPTPPREWVVNLDLPPKDRWPMEQMIPYYNQSIHDALAFLNRVLPSELIAAAEDIAELLIPEFGGKPWVQNRKIILL